MCQMAMCILHCTVLYITVDYYTLLNITINYYILLYITVLHIIVFCFTLHYLITLYFTVLYCKLSEILNFASVKCSPLVYIVNCITL